MTPWIKMRTDLRGDPRVRAITLAVFGDDAKGFNRNVSTVIGALYSLWTLAEMYTADGELKTYTAGGLDAHVGIPGFAAAMADPDVGWLKIGDKCLILPEFSQHMGQLAKIRANGAKRQERFRAVTVKSSPEERRGDKKRNKAPAAPDPNFSLKGVEIPAPLRTPDFLSAWRDWEKHLRQKKVRTTDAADRQQLTDCLAWGAAAAAEAIRCSIRGNYQGLFPPRGGSTPTPPAPAGSVTKTILHGEV